MCSYSHVVRCPHCDQDLHEAKVSGVTLCGCGRCGGIWLDNAGSTRVARALERDVVNMADRASRTATTPFGSAKKALPCPVCVAALSRTEHAGIALDVCTAHGTWFDRDELQEVSRRNMAKRSADAKASLRASGVDPFAPMGAAPTALNAAAPMDDWNSGAGAAASDVAVSVGIDLAIGIVGTLLSSRD